VGKRVGVVRVLGRKIWRKLRDDGQPGFLYWRRDIARIKKALKPYAQFTDTTGTWIPDCQFGDDYKYIHRNLTHWFHGKGRNKRGRCPFLPEGRLPRRELFLTLAPGHHGLSDCWFYLKADLDLIEKKPRRKEPAR
jgi:hypothetical protein